MKISIAGYSSSILKSLIATGRYRLNTSIHKGNFVISATGLKKTVSLRGKEINDLVTYSICLPQNVSIKQNTKKNFEQGMVKANTL